MSDVEALYPVTPAQQGMIFHALEQPGSGVYVQQLACSLHGSVDVEALRLAWRDVAAHHAAFRTSFLWDDVDRPLQVVHASAEMHVEVDPTSGAAAFEDAVRRERATTFDLGRASLSRVLLVRLAAERVGLVWTHHHAILDGWSLPLVLRDLFQAYGARARGAAPVLAEPPSFKPYAAWLRAAETRRETSNAFFTELLRDVGVATPLPLERRVAPPLEPSQEPHRARSVVLDADETARLSAFLKAAGLTLASVVAGAWALLLRRHAGGGDVVFGVTVSGRPPDLAGASAMIGMFINTLPLRARFEDESNAPMSAPDVLASVQSTLLGLQEHAHRPLAEIQRLSGVPAGQPLFESLIVVENYPQDAGRSAGASDIRVVDVQTIERTSYALTLVCAPGERVELRLLYDPTRFDAVDVDAVLDRLRVILADLASGRRVPADAVALVRPEEQRALADARARTTPSRASATLPELFAASAARHADAVAITCGRDHLSYARLAARASSIAALLAERRVVRGSRVAVCLDRGVDLIAAVLGILEAGAAYVPLDPQHPAERLLAIAADAGAHVILTSRASDPARGETGGDPARGEIRRVDVVHVESATPGATRVRPALTPEDLAYVLYTSGSSGMPKGVKVTHANVVRLFTATAPWFSFDGRDVWTLFHSIAFDFSVWEIFGALLHGGRLVVVPRSVARAPDEMRALLSRERVTILNQTPSAFEQLMLADASDSTPLALRVVIFGGEALPVDRLAPWFERHGDAVPRLVNMYGITETTVHVTYRPISRADIGVRARRGASPIGRAIPDLTVHVLDAEGGAVPYGVPGEIWVGGAGVAAGYHARDELDAARFVRIGGVRLYRSGDLGRFVSESELEYIGRADDQVKVRGHRIEPGEIEAAALTQGDAVACTVVLREDEGERRLVAYVVPRPDIDASKRATLATMTRDWLRARLPEPMVPSAIVVLDRMPLTANGKIDRAQLPSPFAPLDAASVERSPARSEDPLERLVVDAWARVLRREGLGADDDVFALGAHSLLVTQVASRLRALTGHDVPLRALFDNPTPALLTSWLRARAPASHAQAPLVRVPRKTAGLPLSFAQRRLWFLDRLEASVEARALDGGLYTIPFAARIRGGLDQAALARAVGLVLARHEALRSYFVAGPDGEPVQHTLADVAVPLEVVDLSATLEDREASWMQHARNVLARTFDLAKAPLLRATLYRLGTEHVLLFCVHHIVADGWSLAVLVRDLVACYAGEDAALPPLAVDYPDYAVWQRQWLAGPMLDERLAWFRGHLAGAPPVVDLSSDRARPLVPSYAAGDFVLAVDTARARAVGELARRLGATASMVLLAALHALLLRWSSQGDVSIGVSVAGRTHREIEDLVGFFVNVLVVRATPASDATFGELVATIRSATLDAYARQDVPFEQVVEAMRPTRTLSHAPLFQVNFVHQNVPFAQLWDAAGDARPDALSTLALSAVVLPITSVRFDLVVTVEEPPTGGYRVSFTYATDLFEESTVAAFAAQYDALLASAVTDEETPLQALVLGPAAVDRAAVIDERAPLHELIAEVAKHQPDAIALAHGESTITYAELIARALATAARLRAAGVGEGARVAVAMRPSIDRVVAVLGTLFAGAAFVPIEPSLPLTRKARILERGSVGVAIVDEASEDDLPVFAGTVLRLDAASVAEARASRTTATASYGRVPPDAPAYVLFTSGSTGQPKGVVVHHAGLANLALAQAAAFDVRAGDRVLAFASFAFDAAVSEIGMALVRGATLDLGEADAAPHEALARTLRARRISVVTLPPTLLRLVRPSDHDGFPDLRVLVSAGEPLFEETARAWAASHRRIFNAYGPTETTVCATVHALPPPSTTSLADGGRSRVPIGRALAGMVTIVVDDGGAGVPVGVAGELWVGGVGLALEYAGDAEQTDAVFPIADPAGTGAASRWYRTGDRVRRRADGALEYLGRYDDRVKLAGVRIELGDVESALLEHAAVAEAAARVVADDAGERLVAYVVLAAGATAERSAIVSRARELLPRAMVPSALVVLEAMPRTPSGKIDRARLPAPHASTDEEARKYTAPETDLERTVAVVWAGLLRVPRLGRDDDFFELGGHSLIALQAAARLRDALGVDPPLRLVFENPTPALFARALALRLGDAASDEAPQVLARVPRAGALASFAEERLWFLEQLTPGTSAYVLASAFRLRGALDTEALARAVEAVVARHEALRTTFHATDLGLEARVVATVSGVFSEHVVPSYALERFLHDAVREPIALDRGPLVGVRLVCTGVLEHVLLLTLHHAIADAWSLEVIARDLARAYAGGELEATRYGVVDFAAWQRNELAGARGAELVARVRARLAGAKPVLALPVDRRSPDEPWAPAGRSRRVVPASLVAKVRARADAHHATPFMIQLAAFVVALGRWTGERDLVIGTPAADRPHQDLEDVVGNFLGTLVVRVDAAASATVGELLTRVRYATLDAFADRALPFERLVEATGTPRDLGHNPVFQTLFSTQTSASREKSTFALRGIDVTPVDVQTPWAKLDLSFGIGPHDSGALEVVAEFRRDRYDTATIDGLVAAWQSVLEALVGVGDDAPLACLADAAAQPYAAALRGSNETTREGFGSMTIVEHILRCAREQPDAVAIEQGDERLTYAMVLRDAASIARALTARGVASGDRVGVTLRRTPRLVAALLAVLSLGAAYVPLAVDLPAARRDALIADAGVRVVLRDDALPAALASSTGDDAASLGAATPGDVAYVLFTSGSTGVPKGVAIGHAALANVVLAFAELLDLGPADRWLAVTPLSFDIAGLELWAPLVTGGTVLLATEDEARDGRKLAAVTHRSAPTVLQATPATFRMLLTDTKSVHLLSNVRVLCGGEALTSTLAGELLARSKELWNVYGPTETTIWSTALRVTPSEVARGGYVAIGRPIANTRAEILDEQGQPLSVGAIGELWLAGMGVAEGYVVARGLSDPFVDAPWARPGRAYRTGDRARWRADGVLLFEGRGDTQIKLRGHRIELGEIEAHLEAHPSVHAAVASLDSGEHPRSEQEAWLVAYVVHAEGAVPPTEEALLAYLRERLPPAMVPAWIEPLLSLPLTANGKVDRRSLPSIAALRRAATPSDGGDRLANYVTESASEMVVRQTMAQVLRLESVAREASFFALGGHSLLATELVLRLGDAFHVAVPLRAVFEAPTVAALAARIEALKKDARDPVVVPRPASATTLASPAQERMWILARLEPDAATWHLPVALRLHGHLDVDALARALEAAVERHAPLRSAFRLDEALVVRIDDAPRYELTARPTTPSGIAAEIERVVRLPFDLGAGRLLRAELLSTGPVDHVLIVVVHHIAADAWSMPLLARDVARAYEARVAAAPYALPQPAIDYYDWAHDRRVRLRDRVALDTTWYAAALADLEVFEILPDRSRRDRDVPPRAGYVTRTVDTETATRLRARVRREGVTLFVGLLAALDLVLARFAGALDVRVGTAIAGRDSSDTRELVGLFVNTLVLRTRLDSGVTVGELLARANATVLDAFAHADAPFDAVVRAVAPARDLERTALFQTLFLMNYAPHTEGVAIAGVTFEPIDIAPPTSPFELTFAASERPDGSIDLGLEHRADLFEGKTIDRLLDVFEQTVGALAEAPSMAAALDLAPPVHGAVLVGPPSSESPLLVHIAFEQAARSFPDATAIEPLTGVGDALDYRGLDKLASGVAGALVAAGAVPGARVAIDLGRSPRLLAAILGAWRCGVAYVPLDPRWPPARKGDIARDAALSLCIDERGVVREGAPFASWAEVAAVAFDASRIVARPDFIAYVLYTSGSTGAPKGVEVTHASVASFVATMAKRFGLDAHDRVLQFASPSFDASLEEIGPALATGATLVYRDDEAPGSFQAFFAAVDAARISVLDLPTAFWHAWIDSGGPDVPANVRLVVVGGEAATLERLRSFRAWPHGARVVWMNTYGPTEATVSATAFTLAPDEAVPSYVPIGAPLDGVSGCVIDARGRVADVGAPGELVLGGGGVARGYLGAPDATAARFVPSLLDQTRAYRTGDRVRLRNDGHLEFLGRSDAQLKVRGHRVEPAEIEAALRLLGAASASVVVQDGDLVAFVVGPKELDVASMRRDLAGRLPEVMVPRAVVRIDALPLSTAGKVDLTAFPQVPRSGREVDQTSPRTPLERELATMWCALLGAREVHVEDDFFALGGHSLLATQLLSRVRSRLGVELSLRALFESSTLGALAEAVEAAQRAPAPTTRPLGPRRVIGDLPLSHAQARLFFLDRLEPGRATYNLPGAVELVGLLDVEALARAVRFVGDRHDVLRSTVEDIGGRPVQTIAAPGAIEVTVHHLEAAPERRAAALRFAETDAATPFDLARGPLVRASLLVLAPDHHVLVTTMHHIVADGWSTAILFREVAAAYSAYAANRLPDLPALPIQYADFAAWQRESLAGDDLERRLTFFRRSLADAPPYLDLPTDHPRPRVQGHAGRDVAIELDRGLADRIAAYARARGATPFAVLLAGLHALLGRLAGTTDVLVGASVANRTREEVEPLIGFFVNIVVLRADLALAATFAGLVDQTRDRAIAALEHEDVPFDRVVEALSPERSLGHAPLFQVNFVLQNAPSTSFTLPGLEARALASGAGSARFDLIFAVEESANGYKGTLTYRTDLFEHETALRFAAAWRTLLDAGLDAPDTELRRLPLTSAEERGRAITRGQGPVIASSELPLPRMIEEVVTASPGRVALRFRDESITYGALDRRANQLARFLAGAGAGRGVRVAILLPRCPARIEAVLAVMKSGASFVPIDERNPPPRIAHILADAGVAIVVTNDDIADRLPVPVGVLVVLEEHEATLTALDDSSLPSAPALGDEAYVLYTSGSTGAPKGVAVPHRGLPNLALAQRRGFGVRATDVVLQFASFGFDAAVSEVAMALTAGAVLDLGEGGDFAVDEPIEALLARRAVTVVTLPPSLLALAKPSAVPGLRVVVSAGEALPPSLAERWREGRAVFNAYGPTEATVCTCIYEVGAGGGERARTPIGRPLPNVAMHVVDDLLVPVLRGVTGEIVVGGVGVATGYVGSSAHLGEDRFVVSPTLGRVYRTGDLGRENASGELEVIGRTDTQIKLHGHRIELGEIEHVLESTSRVQSAAVVLDDRGTAPVLVAFVVAAGDATEQELRAFVAARLPSYMVPSRVVRLDALPRATNGKVDRRALADLDRTASASDGGTRIPPRTHEERVLAAAFERVLGRIDVGATDNFFELGGDSILSLQVVALAAAGGVRVTAKEVFEHQTVERLAVAADCRPASEARATQRAHDDGDVYTPTPMQQGMLFHALYDPLAPVYVSQLSARIEGPLDVARLRAAWGRAMGRHDVLRTSFAWGADRPIARVHAVLDVPLTIVDMPDANADELDAFAKAERARGVDPSRAPLFRVAVARIAPEVHELVWTHHHLVLDGWSVAIVLDELMTDVLGVAAQRPPALPFRAYADWLQQHDHAGARRWFKARLGHIEQPTPLGLGRERSGHESVALVREVSQRLTAESTARLAAFARTNALTASTVVIGAWAELLARYARASEVVVGVTMAARPPELANVSEAVGLYLNTLPIVVPRAPEGTSMTTWLTVLQRELATLREHADTPLASAQACSGVSTKTPLFESIVVFENFPVKTTAPGAKPSLRLVDVRGAEQTSYPLTVVAAPGEELELRIAYDADRFDAIEIEALVARLAHLLGAIPEALSPTTLPLGDDADAMAAQLCGRRAVASDVLPAWFARTAVTHAASVAVVDPVKGRLSYEQLRRRVERLASELGGRGVRAEARVAVCVPRSAELVIALLAVAAAGGAFVPLDPAHPAARLEHQIADSGAKLVLATSATEHLARSIAGDAQVLLVNAALEDAATQADTAYPHASTAHAANARPAVLPSHVAYVLYTSGSTGRPKGVMVEHRGLSTYLAWARDAYEQGPGDSSIVHTSAAFDLTLTTLLLPLVTGGHVVLAPEGDGIAPLALALASCDGPPSLLKMTPAHAALLLAELGPTPRPLARTIVIGGERLAYTVTDALAAIAPNAVLFNEYGPTETVVGCVVERVHRAEEKRERGNDVFVPIGRPIAGAQLSIVDRELRPVPVGVAGELLIAGDGVARGYANRGEETAARFLRAPGGALTYRTGDLVVLGFDGRLRFLGREDEQVKVRGHRVELGEVEAALRRAPGVTEAAVVLVNGRLVAHVVATAPSSSLLAHLRAELPAAFVPSELVVHAALPLTANGKVDRKALVASPSDSRSAPLRDAGEAPVTSTEHALADIWQAVLGTNAIARDDDFFMLGGDSILALQVIARSAAAGMALRPRQMFESPTLRAMAAATRPANARSSRAVALPGPVPLTPIQRWFFAADRRNYAYYNQSVLLRCRAPVDATLLEEAASAVFEHHGLDRTRFVCRRGEADSADSADSADAADAGGWAQEWLPASTPRGVMSFVDLSHVSDADLPEAITDACARAQRSFNLERGPLATVVLIATGPARDARLLVAVHHLVVDAVSFRILLGDLEVAWRARVTGHPIVLEPIAARFVDHARLLEAIASDAHALSEDVPHWSRIASARAARLPLDREGGGGTSEPRTLRRALPRHAVDAVVAALPRGVALHDALIAAMGRALAGWTGSEEVVLAVEGHGREELPGVVLDLSRAVGWFTSLYPLVVVWRDALTPSQNLEAAARAVKELPRHGISFGILRYASPDRALRQRLSAIAPEVSFNYLGRLDGVLTTEGAFAAATESRGPEESEGEPRAHLVEVNALVAGGELVHEWSYDAALHDEATLARVARAFEETLAAFASAPRSSSTASRAEPVVTSNAGASRDDIVVTLKKSGRGAPIFLVHPVGGQVGCYAELGRALTVDHPVFGIQAQGVDGDAPYLETVEAMAERYLDAIRSVVGDGHFSLAGWSMGALIAHAIAVLAGSGRLAGPLVAIDQTPAEVSRELDDAALLVEIVGDVIPLEAKQLRTLDPDAQIRWVLAEAERRGLPLAGLRLDDVRRHVELCKMNFRALASHAPRHSDVPVALLRASDRPSWESNDVDPLAEWRRVTSARVELHPVRGDHVSMMKKPQVVAVALLLQEVLRLG